MSYDSLDRTLALHVSIYTSYGWAEIPSKLIKSLTIKQLATSNSKLSMGEFCRNSLELSYWVGEYLYPGDTTFPSELTFPTMILYWDNKKVKVSISDNESSPVDLGVFYTSGSDVKTSDFGKSYTVVGYDTPDSMNDTYSASDSSTKVSEIVKSIASHTGMNLSNLKFSLSEISSIPNDTTYSALLGYLAGYDGKNLRVNGQGEVEEYWFDTSKDITISKMVQVQGGLTDKQSVSPITAILSGSGSDNTISVGSGNALSYANPYVTKESLQTVLNRIKDFSYNIGSVTWRGNPNVRAGDTVFIEIDEGVTAKFPVMENTISFDGGMSYSSSAYGYEESNSVLGSKSPSERKLEVVYHKLNNALANATELMKGGKGGYYKLLTDESGKPYGYQIADSDPVTSTTNGWIVTKNGMFHSSDGFNTVSKVAITMDGHIVADYVDTGIISDGEGTNGNNWWNLDTGEIHIGNSNVVTKDDGAISSVTTYWLVTDSAQVPSETDENWSKNPPKFKPGSHVWRMNKTEYINPSQKATYSVPVEITSSDISSIETYYRLSPSDKRLYDWIYPSDKTFPGNETYPVNKWFAEWNTEYPEWKAGVYLWIKNKLIYSDGTVKWSEPIINSEYGKVTSLVTNYNTKFEETDKAISLKADSSTVDSYYNDVTNKIEREKTDRSSEIKETADSISQKVTSVSNETVRSIDIQYKTSVSKDNVNADGYLYPSEEVYPSEETYPTVRINSDLTWVNKEPSPTVGHYLWSKYILTYFDETTQKNVTKEFVRLGELESSAYNRTVNNSASINVLDNSVTINAGRIETLNDEVTNQNAKFTVAYDKISAEVSKNAGGIDALNDEVTNQNAKFTVAYDNLSSEVSKKVGENEIISKINQSPESISIKANKLALEGYTTINKNFKIDESGNMTANNGVFTGTIEGSTISGSVIYSTKRGDHKDDTCIEIMDSALNEVPGEWRVQHDILGSYGEINLYDGIELTAYDMNSYNVPSRKSTGGSIWMDKDGVKIQSKIQPDIGYADVFCLFPDNISLYHKKNILYYVNFSDDNEYFYISNGLNAGRPVVDTAIVNGDGHHFISIGWNGNASRLSFFVDNINVSEHISDMKAKTDISPISDPVMNAIGKVNIKQFRMRDKPYNTEVLHYGVLAQSIVKAFKDSGINPDSQFVLGKEPKTNSKDSDDYYTVNKEEFLMARIAYDEKIIKSLEERITELENIVKEKQNELQ